jgi:hypothetical protein
VGAINTISSAYKITLINIDDKKHPILLSAVLYTISSMNTANNMGDKTPP